jgi:oligoendopeptidase F
MEQLGRLDLGARKGKGPGGYNFSLAETGVPFIFMNAVNDFQHVITMLHESGHAVHSFLLHKLPFNGFQHITAEMAELASMTMELLTMDHWNVFFEAEADVKRAKRIHLEGIVKRLSWIATIDRFQHWVYENPEKDAKEREDSWVSIFSLFADTVTDWTGLETYKRNLWKKQLHLFEAPFYYIEYGIAQMAAVALWRNYQANPAEALQAYHNTLALGYTKPLRAMYETASVRLDFSKAYMKEWVDFIREEWQRSYL